MHTLFCRHLNATRHHGEHVFKKVGVLALLLFSSVKFPERAAVAVGQALPRDHPGWAQHSSLGVRLGLGHPQQGLPGPVPLLPLFPVEGFKVTGVTES